MTSNIFNLSGKKACVTGASSGLGKAIASYLNQQGVYVVGVARREAELDSWLSELEQGGNHECNRESADKVVADLSLRDNVFDLAETLNHQYDGVDILINAAGINTRQHADDVSEQGWDKTIELNLSTPFFLAQALVPKMKEKQWGRVINFASLQSFRAFGNGISYGASKGGIAQLTRAMAEAWSSSGINANALAPGFFPTELTGPVFNNQALSEQNAKQTCIGRNGELNDIFGPLHFLCSQASDYVTGQLLFVDGGFSAK